MQIEHSLNTFRIDITFPESDVDMVYSEMVARGVTTSVPHILCGPRNHKCINPVKTPTEASVNFCLQWLWGYVDKEEMCLSDRFRCVEQTELEGLGIEVMSIEGLMMGTCHKRS